MLSSSNYELCSCSCLQISSSHLELQYFTLEASYKGPRHVYFSLGFNISRQVEVIQFVSGAFQSFGVHLQRNLAPLAADPFPKPHLWWWWMCRRHESDLMWYWHYETSLAPQYWFSLRPFLAIWSARKGYKSLFLYIILQTGEKNKLCTTWWSRVYTHCAFE